MLAPQFIEVSLYASLIAFLMVDSASIAFLSAGKLSDIMLNSVFIFIMIYILCKYDFYELTPSIRRGGFFAVALNAFVTLYFSMDLILLH